VAWFLPPRPDKATFEKLMAEEGGRKVAEKWWGRWRQRKDEYYEYEKKLRKKLKEGEILIHEQVGSNGGGVIRNALNGLPFTGDHDLYAIHGPPGPVMTGLTRPPFKVQHGAHVDWPHLPEVLEKGGLDEAEKEIYDRIIKTHAPGGEALLRVNPKAPPTAVSSATPRGLKGTTPGGGGGSGGGEIDGTVVKAVPVGFAGLIAAEKRIAEENKKGAEPGQGKALDPKGKAKAKGAAKPIAKSFAMKGAAHKITVTSSPVKVTMASGTPMLMGHKLGLAKTTLRKESDAGNAAATAQLAEIAAIEEQSRHLEQVGKRAETDPKAEAEMARALDSLCAAVASYGAKYNTTDLDHLDPSSAVAMAVKKLKLMGDQARMKPIDEAVIQRKIKQKLGDAWAELVKTKLAGKIHPLTHAGIVAAYGHAGALDLRELPARGRPAAPAGQALPYEDSELCKLLRGNGFYWLDHLFMKPGRSLTEVAATIVHEATHHIQEKEQDTGGKTFGAYEREFGAFSMQREFLVRMDEERRAALLKAVPDPYLELFKCTTNAELEDYIKRRYNFAPVVLDQNDAVWETLMTLNKIYPRP